MALVDVGEVIAVDGKTIRRSLDAASGKKPLHLVNAWASEAGVAVGQLATEEKSNEITAIPKLLNLLNVKGCVVTTDAMGCQKSISQSIVDNEADYALQLKLKPLMAIMDALRYVVTGSLLILIGSRMLRCGPVCVA